MKRKRDEAIPPSPLPQRAHDWSATTPDSYPVDQTIHFVQTEPTCSPLRITADAEQQQEGPWVPLVDAGLLEKLMSTKSVFDTVPRATLTHARDKANPYELMGRGPFANRAAMKMLELDDYAALTSHAQPGEDCFYFVDLCGGPGGWTEYVLWRHYSPSKKEGQLPSCRGWGMTLRDKPVVWEFGKFCETSRRKVDLKSFPFFGPTKDGDATKNENLNALADEVLQATKGVGVHLLMADGGTDVEGHWNSQEILLRQLLLCEVCAALMCVRVGGSFVCKLFDLFTEFSVGLLFVLWSCFEEVTLVKPFTSRPANSEKFVICRKKKCHPKAANTSGGWYERLLAVNQDFPSGPDAVLLPRSLFSGNADFTEWLRRTNDAMTSRQLGFLSDVVRHLEDSSGPSEYRQEVARKFMQRHGLGA
eukprot:TRINITY_DN20319_c0_g1_i1.p1 TRINITY_DN20319_c0_g1~~TRINITY_DN20319_c0_g1_i1.p1  ORF type:complete len:419 (+),score=68.66 TRINITY_DN20319_c0_g1_i1:776-2032(+)